MEAHEQLFGRGPVAVHVAAVDAPAFEALLDGLAAAHPGAAICRMSGERSRTQTGFFDEVRRTLEIPYEAVGWNVLNEALHDLTWMPAEAYMLAVDKGHLLLGDAHPSALRILGEILDSCRGHVPPGSPAAPRGVLLQSPTAAAEKLAKRLSDAGIAFEPLEGDRPSTTT